MPESRSTIYLDCNATTPCSAEVVEAMLPFFTEEYGNPSSSHIMGRGAHRHVEVARRQVAHLIGATASEVLFTSGATESNNIAILGLGRRQSHRRKVLCSAVEHKSVLETFGILARDGFEAHVVPVDATGVILLDRLRDMLDDETALLSIQLANNEIGVVQPVAEAAAMAREVGALVHCDAAQALGKIRCTVADLGVDFASFSSHKVYGPKGVGALYVRAGTMRRSLAPVLGGGGQELGLRPGTLNVPGIVGMGRACECASIQVAQDHQRLAALRDDFERGVLQAIGGAVVVGQGAPRLPNTTSITIPGLPVDVLMSNLPYVCISSGSACTSGAVAPSHVLLAMGVERDLADCTFRASFGRMNTADDVRTAVHAIAEVAAGRRMAAAI